MTNFVTRILGLPMLASEHGSRIDNLIWYVHLLMGALFVGWLAYFIYALIRFRASKNPTADYDGVKNHASSYVEGIVAFLETVLLIGFAIPIWKATVEEFPDPAAAENIHVVGRQFSWTGRYPGVDRKFAGQDYRLAKGDNWYGVDQDDPAGADDFEVMNEIVVPLNRDVIFYLTSMDVIHSLSIRAMRVTQDCTPGLRIPTSFKPVREGSYSIQCAQLCGSGHYKMAGVLKVLPAEEFDAWLEEKNPAAQAESGVVYATEADFE
jgi:cytochrome c oxidase subunit 2